MKVLSSISFCTILLFIGNFSLAQGCFSDPTYNPDGFGIYPQGPTTGRLCRACRGKVGASKAVRSISKIVRSISKIVRSISKIPKNTPRPVSGMSEDIDSSPPRVRQRLKADPEAEEVLPS